MDENENVQQEEMNDENDAREEDIVEDMDSDTKDVEETVNEDSSADVSAIMQRMNLLEEMVTRILGGIDALREAQSIMVENGATIIDDSTDDLNLEVDDFVEPEELDLSI